MNIDMQSDRGTPTRQAAIVASAAPVFGDLSPAAIWKLAGLASSLVGVAALTIGGLVAVAFLF
jgi:uncharacterized membrane protein